MIQTWPSSVEFEGTKPFVKWGGWSSRLAN
jgi:hypothetical protein